jgi:hypothetical protein
MIAFLVARALSRGVKVKARSQGVWHADSVVLGSLFLHQHYY